ncbi:transmembrane protein FAM155A-like [Limulus polyphemus]|uniref:Transmembrane protein FAM155A-like n=1 Tax=Limulus polyphemus TaxID=6850 RepID=A0ABM1S417_LIMPO|nr:transmembrane protein FAM155A-like [Limulus polyphemus]
MTLEHNDGSRTPSLEKPYRKVLQRWRLCSASLLFFTVVLLDNFVACLSVRDLTVYSARFRNPWMPDSFGSNISPTCRVSQGLSQPQCLSLAYLCALSPGREREKHLLNQRPCFCSHYLLTSVLGPRGIKGSPEDCRTALTSVINLDTMAQQVTCEFEALLARYDCRGQYSVRFSCQECEKVYRQWVCAMLLPFFLHDQHIKPCRTFCHRVEQQCPYFHPHTKEQYAGEPVFKCIDPNIPDIPSISPNSAYGKYGHCYQACHVSPHIEPGTCNISISWNNSQETTTVSHPSSLEHTPYMFSTVSSKAMRNGANLFLVLGFLIINGGLWRHLVTKHCAQRSKRWTWPTNFRVVYREPT